MTDRGLAKLWIIVGLGVAYLSINFWSYTQQWRIELPSIVKFNTEIGPSHHITHAAAIFGMLLLGPALLLLLRLTIVYARRNAGRPIAFRIPQVGGLGIDPATAPGRLIQFTTATILLGVPLLAQAHFFRKFIDGTATRENVTIEGWSHFSFDPATAVDGEFRYDTLTYFPFVEAWLFLILEMAIGFLTLRSICALVRRTSLTV
jgi:hypothetical protein